MGLELTDTAPFSRRRNVSYLTSKKANTTMAVKNRKPHRAIRDIKFARDLGIPFHTYMSKESIDKIYEVVTK